jgi:uncharacterized membrane protein YeaQ/YmgE (transglycosylase-associated protein family)
LDITTLIFWILFGAIVGIVARFLVPGADPMGWIGTILLGIIGSFAGGFLAQLFFHGAVTFPPPTTGWIGSIVGAIVVLLVWRMSQGRRLLA